MESRWSTHSFLLEMKPHHSENASLFINCPWNAEEQKVKVFQSEILISSMESSENFKTAIDQIRLQPDTISNCSWTDADTFTCKLGVDSYDSDIDVDFRCTSDIVQWIGGELSLRRFCENLSNGRRICLDCQYCQCSLLSEPNKLKRAYPLPSDDWNEISSEWFCHQHHGSEDDDLVRHAHSVGDLGALQTQGLKPTPEQVLVGELFALVHKDAIGEKVSVSDLGIVSCVRCNAGIGRLKPVRVKKDNSRQMQAAETTYEIYHVASKLHGKPTVRKLSNSSISPNNSLGSQESLVSAVPKSYIETRFINLQRYFAWYLLSESETQSTVKFVIRTLTNEPKVLLWMLDAYSIITVGRLARSGSCKSAKVLKGSGANLFDAADEQKENGSIQKLNGNNLQSHLSANKIRSFPVVKLLYKVIDETNSNDPRINGMDWSVGNIVLPEHACIDLKETLVSSSLVLPTPCRMVGQFNVGYLKVNETL